MKQLTHTEAFEVVSEASRRVLGYHPNHNFVQVLAAMGMNESGYGHYFAGFNWGAVTAGSSWTGDVFEHHDTRPGPDGADIKYTTNFRAYHSHASACEDMIRVACSYKGAQEAAESGGVGGFSRALYTPKPGYKIGYYSGIAKHTPEERVWRHAHGIYRSMIVACRETGQFVGGTEMLSPETIRRGSTGPWVCFLREVLECPASTRWDSARQMNVSVEDFDSVLEKAVVSYQENCKLAVDGVVGPSTWAAIYLDDFEEKQLLGDQTDDFIDERDTLVDHYDAEALAILEELQASLNRLKELY